MDDLIEITELDLNDSYGGNNGTTPRQGSSSNFGGGLELLMNDKVKDNYSSKSDIGMGDLDRLEDELNELVDGDAPSSGSGFSYAPKSDLFGGNGGGSRPSVSFGNDEPTIKLSHFDDDEPSIGKATHDLGNDGQTWDGYAKFNNIPLNPDRHVPLEPKRTPLQITKAKIRCLKKLEKLEKAGVDLTKKYTMESSLEEMEAELEIHEEEAQKKSAIKLQGQVLRTIVGGIEWFNEKFNPFDLYLEGLSDQIEENIDDYDDIFAELHEKYKGRGKIAPELNLLFRLGGSAIMVHMTNSMFKSSVPGVDDILRQNPDLMRSFQQAAVQSMSQSHPGFAGFMGGVMNDDVKPPIGRGPPPPVATQGPNAVPVPTSRPGNNDYARPDLNYSRGNYEDGISLRENYTRPDQQERTSQRPTRPEMKGPSDIGDILSGLKTKTINIQQTVGDATTSAGDSSTISLDDLKNIQSSATMPKKSGRRKKSASNTVSLDI